MALDHTRSRIRIFMQTQLDDQQFIIGDLINDRNHATADLEQYIVQSKKDKEAHIKDKWIDRMMEIQDGHARYVIGKKMDIRSKAERSLEEAIIKESLIKQILDLIDPPPTNEDAYSFTQPFLLTAAPQDTQHEV